MGEFDNLLADFLTESREHLASIEPDLLEMERSGATTGREVLHRVFRAIHSIKGASGFFSYTALKKLSHAMENVLMPIRDGQMAVSPDIMDVLLAGVDTLRAMLDDIGASDQVPCDDLLNRLAALLAPISAAASARTTPVPAAQLTLDATFDPNAENVKTAVARGKIVQRVRVNLLRDLAQKNRTSRELSDLVLSLGDMIAFPPDTDKLADRLREDLCFSFVMASVLTPDLLCEGLGLPAAQVEAIDLKAAAVVPFVAVAPAPATTIAAPAPQPATESPVTNTPTSTPSPAAPSPASSPATAAAAKHDGTESVRVRVDLLARVMNSASELVLARNQLLSLLSHHAGGIPGLPPVLQRMDRTVSELQERVMQTRMQPIDTLFVKFSRMVRDLSRQMKKSVELAVEGAEVELDKSVIELLGDPLTHLIRNCVDHGLESADDRQAAGKPAAGKILLRAFHQGGQVIIEIRDDGRGIDPRKVLDKALEKGIIKQSAAANMSAKDAIDLIFLPGFSTAAQVTEVSGRGVGLDVVRTNVEKLGGQVEVESLPGRGTTFLLRLPLTLAIIPALMVGAGDQKFAVPQVNLVELVRVQAAEVRERIERVNHQAVLRLRGRLLPLVRLGTVLGLDSRYRTAAGESADDRRHNIADRRGRKRLRPTTAPQQDAARSDRRQNSDYRILVVQVGNNRFGLIVDELFDGGEVVVKPLSSFANAAGCFAGSTITGDGRVILILDVGGIAEKAKLQAVENDTRAAAAARSAAGDGARQSIILFRHGTDELLAVPQEQLLRLERTRRDQIERVGGREFIQYQGSALEVVRLNPHLPLAPLADDADELFLLIPKRPGQRPAGILASRIVDALDVSVTLQPAADKAPGVQGTAVVNGQLALFLDPRELLDNVLEKSA